MSLTFRRRLLLPVPVSNKFLKFISLQYHANSTITSDDDFMLNDASTHVAGHLRQTGSYNDDEFRFNDASTHEVYYIRVW